MKKVLFAFVIATSLVACGGASTHEGHTDSTAVSIDTTAVVDTTAAVAPVADSIAK